MTRAGYLVPDPEHLSPEEGAAWKFLLANERFRNTLLPFEKVPLRPSRLDDLQVLWWHFDSSTELPASALDRSVVDALRRYVKRGGSLFLSLLASQYVVDLGAESVRPNIIEKGTWNRHCWTEKYPDIRGLSSFRGHPIFDGLHGAAYLWCPQPKSSFAGAWYEVPALPANKMVVAVESEYIKLNEDRRMAVEYSLGKGRILIVGTFMFFADDENRFRSHLEKFTLNCLDYLSRPIVSRKTGTVSFWNFEPRTVRFQAHKKQKAVRQPDRSWKPTESGLSLTREKATDNFFDVGGRRLLIMGNEDSGIEEVWAHPLRILKDVKIAFSVSGRAPIPAKSLEPHITVRPESLTRLYHLDETSIEETTFAHRVRPAGAIRFEVKSGEPVEVMLTATVDLRTMWPLSDRATGSLEYSWDDGLQAARVAAPDIRATALIGCSLRPSEYIIGRYAEIEESAGQFVGTPTEAVQVAVGLRYTVDPGEAGCTVIFAGSSMNHKDAAASYGSVLSNPPGRLNEHARYFKSFLTSLPTLKTLDPAVRDSALWAMVSTDLFFADTPGVGTSLMAGYATTRSGWDGGQTISGRPGYAWYFGRDSVWTALAMLAYGDKGKARSVLEFFGDYQDITGKIAHEVTTCGHVHYDAADSTPLYIMLMGRYLRATGDLKFVKHEFSRLLKAIDFCSSTDTDGDHLIENTHVGHGWIEGGPLFPVHAEIYLNACWAAALEEASFIGAQLKRPESSIWKLEARKVRRILNKDFYDPATGFFHFAKNADGTFNTSKTILPVVAMCLGLIEPKKARRCLRLYASEAFSTGWGVRLIARYDPRYDPTGYHCGSVWPLFSGWLGLAEARYGMRKEGLKHITSTLMLYHQFSLGHIPEVLQGGQCEPAGVCPHQAWSGALAVLALLEARKILSPIRGGVPSGLFKGA